MVGAQNFSRNIDEAIDLAEEILKDTFGGNSEETEEREDN